MGTLHDIATNSQGGAAARVMAARTILTQTFRAFELDAVKARIDELEQFLLRKQEQEELDRAGKDDDRK